MLRNYAFVRVCHTLPCLLQLIKPESLNHCFADWVYSFMPEKSRNVTISLDEKTICSTIKMKKIESPLHIISTQVCELGLILVQRCTDDKSNEIRYWLAGTKKRLGKSFLYRSNSYRIYHKKRHFKRMALLYFKPSIALAAASSSCKNGMVSWIHAGFLMFILKKIGAEWKIRLFSKAWICSESLLLILLSNLKHVTIPNNQFLILCFNVCSIPI